MNEQGRFIHSNKVSNKVACDWKYCGLLFTVLGQLWSSPAFSPPALPILVQFFKLLDSFEHKKTQNSLGL